MMLKRYRFKTWSVDDPRPLIDLAPIKMPWWCSGFGTGRHGARPYDDEYAAFASYAKHNPDNATLLVDTYNRHAQAHYRRISN